MSKLFFVNIPYNCSDRELQEWVESRGIGTRSIRIVRECGLVAKGRRKSSRSCRPGTLDGEGRLARAGQVARWQYDEGRERPWSEGR
jgi:hypothetical protein